jgi:hypothetical protein
MADNSRFRPIVARPVRQMSIVLFCGLMTLFLYQNCANYQSSVDPLTGSDNSSLIPTEGHFSSCLGDLCRKSADYVTLTAPQQLFTEYNATNRRFVDVGGFCDSGGYRDIRFRFQWVRQNGTVVALNGAQWTLARRGSTTSSDEVRCIQGRYHVRAQLPVEFGPPESAPTLSMRIEAIPLDDVTGQEIRTSRAGINLKSVQITRL